MPAPWGLPTERYQLLNQGVDGRPLLRRPAAQPPPLAEIEEPLFRRRRLQPSLRRRLQVGSSKHLVRVRARARARARVGVRVRVRVGVRVKVGVGVVVPARRRRALARRQRAPAHAPARGRGCSEGSPRARSQLYAAVARGACWRKRHARFESSRGSRVARSWGFGKFGGYLAEKSATN